MRIQRYLATIMLGLVSVTMASTAYAVDFSGKRVEIIVPFEPGGGGDIYARFLAPLLSKKLPGNPTVIVTNIPGAGGIAGSNQFQRAAPDGLTLISIGSSVSANYVFRDARVKYKLNDWVPIISSPNGTVVYANSSLGIKNISEIAKLRDQKLVMGVNDAKSGDLRTLLSLDGLGLKTQSVFGINRGDARPAFERGEFNLNFDSTAAYKVQVLPMVESGVAIPLFTLGIANDAGEIVRDPLVPDVPTYIEVYKSLNGKEPSGPEFAAWREIFNLNTMAQKGLALPSGTPQDIVDVYISAIKEVVAEFDNPTYKKQANDVIGPYPQSIGPAAALVLRGAATFEDEPLEWLKKWLFTNYQVKL